MAWHATIPVGNPESLNGKTFNINILIAYIICRVECEMFLLPIVNISNTAWIVIVARHKYARSSHRLFYFTISLAKTVP